MDDQGVFHFIEHTSFAELEAGVRALWPKDQFGGLMDSNGKTFQGRDYASLCDDQMLAAFFSETFITSEVDCTLRGCFGLAQEHRTVRIQHESLEDLQRKIQAQFPTGRELDIWFNRDQQVDDGTYQDVVDGATLYAVFPRRWIETSVTLFCFYSDGVIMRMGTYTVGHSNFGDLQGSIRRLANGEVVSVLQPHAGGVGITIIDSDDLYMAMDPNAGLIVTVRRRGQNGNIGASLELVSGRLDQLLLRFA